VTGLRNTTARVSINALSLKLLHDGPANLGLDAADLLEGLADPVERLVALELSADPLRLGERHRERPVVVPGQEQLEPRDRVVCAIPPTPSSSAGSSTERASGSGRTQPLKPAQERQGRGEVALSEVEHLDIARNRADDGLALERLLLDSRRLLEQLLMARSVRST
jgi:hypothetical protein